MAMMNVRPEATQGPLPVDTLEVTEAKADNEGALLCLVPWASVNDAQPQAAQIKPKSFVTTRRQIDLYLQDKLTTGVISRQTSLAERWMLVKFSELCPEDPSRITRRYIIRWLKTTSHLAPGTRRLYQGRVKSFTDWLLRRGVLRKDPFLDVPMPKVPRAVHRAFEPEQARALIAACIEPRDLVVVVLGLHTGLRRAELAALQVGDVNLSARTVFVVDGKGGHQRMLPLSTEAAAVVARYVAEQGLRTGPLLRSLSQPHRGIRPGTVSRIFDELARRAGVKVAAWDTVGCHSLRHTAATSWYQTTADVLAVRDLLGHVNLGTTARYVKGMNVEALRAAVEGRTYLDRAPS